MTNITLNGTAPVLIQQAQASGFSLQNTGPGNAYLGNDASVTPSTGYTVIPGTSLPLNGGVVLYACTDNGKTASVQLLQGATSTAATVVEANVPGAIEATITNPTVNVGGSVNATITNASIPVSGNVDINSGSVTVNGGTVGLTQRADILYSNSNFNAVSGIQTVYTSTGVDLSKYQMIYVYIQSNLAVSTPASITNVVETWSSGSTFLSVNTNYSFFGTGGIYFYSSVKEPVYQLSINPPTGISFQIAVLGLGAAQTPHAHLWPIQQDSLSTPWASSNFTFNAQLRLQGFTGFDAVVTATGSGIIYPAHTTGLNQYHVEIPGASGGAIGLQYYPPTANAGRIQQLSPTAPFYTNPTIPVQLLAYPIVLSTAGTTAAGTRFIATLASPIGAVS